MQLIRSLLLSLLVILVGSVFGQPASQSETKNLFDSSPWLDDFHQLLREMSAHYANLQWAAEGRKMDLPALRAKTEAQLRSARSPEEAKKTLTNFADAFGDGHFEINWPKLPAESKTPTPDTFCGRLGYRPEPRLKPGIEFSSLPNFSQVPSEEAQYFPGGLLKLSDSLAIGTMRISLFSEHIYPQFCEEALAKLGIDANKPCDEACSNQIEREVGNHLGAILEARSNQLRAAGANTILVDITENGGGFSI